MSTFSEIEGSIAIEMGKGTYVYSLDTGLFTLGGPHKECKSSLNQKQKHAEYSSFKYHSGFQNGSWGWRRAGGWGGHTQMVVNVR